MKTKSRGKKADKHPDRVKKSERRRQILLELKLRPHVRIGDFADRFKVSTETVRRDLDALANDGLISRAHGGASAPTQGHHPGLAERSSAQTEERERIGRCAAELIEPGETIMIDSGTTTIQLARALAYLDTPCTVITNSIQVAMTLGPEAPDVILCPGEYMPAESAVVGTETLDFLERFNVDRCFIGATGLSVDGPSESVRGFAAIKRTMLRRAVSRHLLIDRDKFGRRGLAQVGGLQDVDSVVVDQRPTGDLWRALTAAQVALVVAT